MTAMDANQPTHRARSYGTDAPAGGSQTQPSKGCKSTVSELAELHNVADELVRLADAGIRPQVVAGLHREEREFFELVEQARRLTRRDSGESGAGIVEPLTRPVRVER